MTHTHDFTRRYVRHAMLAEVGVAGQERLRQARVLVVGAGGLGAPLITYLATSGIGHLGIIDADRVELSNLPRQMIYETGDIGRLKVESAADRVAELAPDCNVTIYPYALDRENVEAMLPQYDLVADGCDHFATRLLINQHCVARNIPLVSAAVAGFDGQVMSVLPHAIHAAGCYQCLVHPEAVDARRCDLGILSPFAGQIGTLQALEVLRVLLGFPALGQHLLVVDGRTAMQRLIARRRDASCAICAG